MGVAASKKRRTVVVTQEVTPDVAAQIGVKSKNNAYPSEPPPTYEESEEISVSYDLQPNETPVPYNPAQMITPSAPPLTNEASCSYSSETVQHINGISTDGFQQINLTESLQNPVPPVNNGTQVPINYTYIILFHNYFSK